MSEGARAGGKGGGSVKRRREDGGKGVRLLYPRELPAAMMQRVYAESSTGYLGMHTSICPLPVAQDERKE